MITKYICAHRLFSMGEADHLVVDKTERDLREFMTVERRKKYAVFLTREADTNTEGDDYGSGHEG